MRPLLAVTPPAGAIDPGCVERWHEAGAAGRVAVWLREPGARPTALLGPRFAGLVARARALDVPLLLGISATDLDEAARLVQAEALAGVVLRGDPDRETLAQARACLRDAWLGRSSHDPAAGDHARCDFTALAPVFAPHTGKPFATAPLGLPALARAAAQPDAFVVALGGVDAATARACVEAGAKGLAGIRSFFGAAQTVAQDVAAFCTALQTTSHAQTPSPGRARGRGPTA